MRYFWPRLSAGALLAAIAGLGAAQSLPDYRAAPFALDHVGERIMPVDMNGDGRNDLLTADKNRLSLYLQPSDGNFQFNQPSAVLELPGSAVGWDVDVSSTSKAGHRPTIVALVNGNTLLGWTLGNDGFGDAQTLLQDLPGFIPNGAYPLKLVRDFNDDGRNDIVVPASGQLYLHLQQADGGYANALPLKTNVWVESDLRANGVLTEKIGQRVRIPRIRLRDLNNDERNDLIAWSDQVLEVYLAERDGTYPPEASYRFDAGEVDERMGDIDFDQVDFSNLSGLLAYTWDFELDDMDGDKIEDLLLREGGKVTLYGGTADGINFEQPRQVLKSSGNVLAALMVDENNDGRKDLWLMRVEQVSLGNIFVWLAVSGSLDIETFVYENNGERFARRPSRKITVTVKFPSLLRSADMVGDAFDPEQHQALVRSTIAQLQDDDRHNDLFVLRPHGLSAYRDALSDQTAQRSLLGLPNYSPDKDKYVLDFQDFFNRPEELADRNLARIRGREPDLTLNLDEETRRQLDLNHADLAAADLNGDGHDDILLFLERDEGTVKGLIFYSVANAE